MVEPSTDSLFKKSYGRRWALLVGVNHYADAAISDLRVCVGDVQAVHNLLIANGYESSRMRLLLAPGETDYLPTRAEILATLTSVAQAADEEDLLLFYFSGHGMTHDSKAYIMPTDTRYTAVADTAISLNRVKQIVQASAARAKVIVLDACHSGAQIGKSLPEMTDEFVRRVFEEAEGMAILSSCKQRQVSWEWPEKGQSVFTHYLLEGLQGTADSDGKGFVTVGDLSRFVVDRVKAWAVQHSRAQTPTLQYSVVGDIVLMMSPPDAHVETHGASLIILETLNIDAARLKNVGKSSMQQPTEKAQVTKLDVLKALYKAYRELPGEWMNSERIRSGLALSRDQMSDIILILRERGFIETKTLGDRALLKIAADGVAVLQE